MASQHPTMRSQSRLGELRHDLRNPLGEIIGFAEMLMEEATERHVPELLEGLGAICRSAHRILSEVNNALNPDTERFGPAVLNSLNDTVQSVGNQIIEGCRALSDKCDGLQQPTIGDDLLRISGSVRRLCEIAPRGIEGLISEASSPLAIRPSPGAQADSAEPREPVEPGSGGAILVVDDQETNRALLARRLRKRGYTVSLAENGRHALERLRARSFDLVLLDIVMPEMDGVEVLRRVKADQQLAHIPVLMLSALDELNAVVRCIELGAADYLPKPFPPAILHARVEASLANKRMADQLRKYTGWLFGRTLFSDAVAAPAAFLALSRRERTILFADIRGFTAWSEGHSPEEAVTLLNRYFETAERLWADSEVIKSEYTGDEIMGVFDKPTEAVRIAQRFRLDLGSLLAEYGLGIGVGLHTGLVLEGLIGGTEVKAYRFVGDTVNTAKRICTEAQSGQVLLSADVCRQLDGSVATGVAYEIRLKGKTDALEVRIAV